VSIGYAALFGWQVYHFDVELFLSVYTAVAWPGAEESVQEQGLFFQHPGCGVYLEAK
jgi:hypothetical protein